MVGATRRELSKDAKCDGFPVSERFSPLDGSVRLAKGPAARKVGRVGKRSGAPKAR